MAKQGRPCKLTPEAQDAICGGIMLGLPIRDCAALGGVSAKTYHEWIARGRESSRGKFREFLHATELAQAEFRQRAHAVIVSAAQRKDWRAMAWLLEHRFPEDYAKGRAVTSEDDHAGEVSEDRASGPATDGDTARAAILRVVTGS